MGNQRTKKCSCSQLLPTLAAWVILLGVTGVYFAFPGFQLARDFSMLIPVTSGVLLLIVMVNLAMATFVDPGFLPRAAPDEPLYEENPATYKVALISGVQVKLKFCSTCSFYRPPRVSHCSTCNRCLEVFDHHCPWVANCVGRRNYRYFFVFLSTLTLHMVVVIAFCLMYVIVHINDMSTPVCIVSLGLAIVVGLLVLPVGGLTFFHMSLVARGMTTNEQVTGKFRNAENPYDAGCWMNCCGTVCGPLYPKFVLQHSKVLLLSSETALQFHPAAAAAAAAAPTSPAPPKQGLFSPHSSPMHTAKFSRIRRNTQEEHSSLSSIDSAEPPRRNNGAPPALTQSPIYTQRNIRKPSLEARFPGQSVPLLTQSSTSSQSRPVIVATLPRPRAPFVKGTSPMYDNVPPVVVKNDPPAMVTFQNVGKSATLDRRPPAENSVPVTRTVRSVSRVDAGSSSTTPVVSYGRQLKSAVDATKRY